MRPPILPPGFAGPVGNNIECSILVSTYSYHMSALDDHQPKEPLEVELRNKYSRLSGLIGPTFG